MINIVLYKPEIPQNTGNVARTCAVTGARLHLIGPMGFKIDDTKLKRAGLDYWHYLDISYYGSYEEYIEKHRNILRFYATTSAKKYYHQVRYEDDCHLVFGQETAGMPTEILEKNEENCIRIPQRDYARCLNLSNSVAIVCYEAIKNLGFKNMV